MKTQIKLISFFLIIFLSSKSLYANNDIFEKEKSINIENLFNLPTYDISFEYINNGVNIFVVKNVFIKKNGNLILKSFDLINDNFILKDDPILGEREFELNDNILFSKSSYNDIEIEYIKMRNASFHNNKIFSGNSKIYEISIKYIKNSFIFYNEKVINFSKERKEKYFRSLDEFILEKNKKSNILLLNKYSKTKALILTESSSGNMGTLSEYDLKTDSIVLNTGTWEIVNFNDLEVLKIKPKIQGYLKKGNYLVYIEKNGYLYKGIMKKKNLVEKIYLYDELAKDEILDYYYYENVF